VPYPEPHIARIYDDGWLPLVWGVKDVFGLPEFDEAKFRSAFGGMGTRVQWDAVGNCPCGTAQSPNLSCATCGGDGYYVHHTQIVRAVCSELSKESDPLQRLQPIEPGTAIIGLRGEHVPAVNDRLTFLEGFVRISGMFQRRATLAAHLERLRYPVAPWTIATMAEGDVSQMGTTVNQVWDVVDLRVAKAGVVGPALVKGSDFTVTAAGLIDWALGDVKTPRTSPEPPGTGQAVGEWFSVYYHAHPVYRVTEHSQALRPTRHRLKTGDTVQHLPVAVKARLDWLIQPSEAQ